MHISDGVPVSPGSPYCQCEKCGGFTLISVNSPRLISEYAMNEPYYIDSTIIPLSLLNNDEYKIQLKNN